MTEDEEKNHLHVYGLTSTKLGVAKRQIIAFAYKTRML